MAWDNLDQSSLSFVVHGPCSDSSVSQRNGCSSKDTIILISQGIRRAETLGVNSPYLIAEQHMITV
ncbi:unnamed protein product [Sphenostylis stenocarpa]|uniref:Uncharacterized protein n=1 Tax=Sphenostylis stenocarpa TaxID=92480 RepID=A0AA86W4T0_9FABA|nr:unnamed protein product [Sphenostylis stenocarpa]